MNLDDENVMIAPIDIVKRQNARLTKKPHEGNLSMHPFE
jgi:hypothetical protein